MNGTCHSKVCSHQSTQDDWNLNHHNNPFSDAWNLDLWMFMGDIGNRYRSCSSNAYEDSGFDTTELQHFSICPLWKITIPPNRTTNTGHVKNWYPPVCKSHSWRYYSLGKRKQTKCRVNWWHHKGSKRSYANQWHVEGTKMPKGIWQDHASFALFVWAGWTIRGLVPIWKRIWLK